MDLQWKGSWHSISTPSACVCAIANSVDKYRKIQRNRMVGTTGTYFSIQKNFVIICNLKIKKKCRLLPGQLRSWMDWCLAQHASFLKGVVSTYSTYWEESKAPRNADVADEPSTNGPEALCTDSVVLLGNLGRLTWQLADPQGLYRPSNCELSLQCS